MELKLRFSSIFAVLKFVVSGLLMQIGHQARGGGRGEVGSLIYIYIYIYIWHYEKCGFQTVYYISYASNVRRIRQQLWFNHRCKDLGLVPRGLRLKSPLNTQEAIFIDIIAPKWIRALLKLAYFLSRDLSSTPG